MKLTLAGPQKIPLGAQTLLCVRFQFAWLLSAAPSVMFVFPVFEGRQVNRRSFCTPESRCRGAWGRSEGRVDVVERFARAQLEYNVDDAGGGWLNDGAKF